MSKNSTQKMFKPLKLTSLSKEKPETPMPERIGEQNNRKELQTTTDQTQRVYQHQNIYLHQSPTNIMSQFEEINHPHEYFSMPCGSDPQPQTQVPVPISESLEPHFIITQPTALKRKPIKLQSQQILKQKSQTEIHSQNMSIDNCERLNTFSRASSVTNANSRNI